MSLTLSDLVTQWQPGPDRDAGRRKTGTVGRVRFGRLAVSEDPFGPVRSPDLLAHWGHTGVQAHFGLGASQAECQGFGGPLPQEVPLI